MTDLPGIDPSKTALLLMDFEPGILGMIPTSGEALERARDALSWARSHKIQVGFVRVAFTEADFGDVPDRNKAFAPVAANKFLSDDDPATQLHPAMKVADQDIVVRKTRVGAFSTTDLSDVLTSAGIDTLVLGGVSTAGVILSTVRAAADADYRVYVLDDASADPNPEVHRTLMDHVFPGQAHVITTAALEALVN
jgi:nicotinamidase-related amidase